MFMALSSIWMLLLLFGTSAFLVPSLCILSLTFGDAFGARYLLYGAKSFDVITRVNDMVLIGLGYLIGYPIHLHLVRELLCKYSAVQGFRVP